MTAHSYPDRGGIGHGVLWDDWPLLSVARSIGPNAPNLTLYRGGIYLFEFVGNGLRELHGSIELTHTYLEGSPIVPHAHWRTNSADASGGVARWGLEYTLTNPENGAVESAPTTIYTDEVIAASSQQYLQHSFDFPAIDMTGRTISTLFAFRFFRDGGNIADTWAPSAWLCGLSLHFQSDTDGSINQRRKP